MKNGWLILSFIFLIQPILPVIEYALNYDYIAEVLCINKENEALQCHGKCHLGKEVAKDFDTTNKSDNKGKSAHEFNYYLFFEGKMTQNDSVQLYLHQKSKTPYLNKLIHEPHIQIFSPPPKLAI